MILQIHSLIIINGGPSKRRDILKKKRYKSVNLVIYIMKQIGILGASSCDETTYEIAFQVGKLLAEKSCTVINGGLGGVMEASSRGVQSQGGIVIGVLPGEKQFANPYIGVSIATRGTPEIW